MAKKILAITVALLATACSNNINKPLNTNKSKDVGGVQSSQIAHQYDGVKTNKPYLNKSSITNSSSNGIKKLNQVYNQWVGTRYRLGGTTRRGIDCSAFMQETFSSAFDMSLPRTTSEQQSLGRRIKKNELKHGDLVFFRGNRHVGVYIGNGQFMHASSSQGVTISSLEHHYWAKTYTQSRRIL